MKRIISGVIAIFTVVFAFNLYNYKIAQKPENKNKVQATLKNAGVDEDTIKALDDTVNTMNNGILAVNRAKELLADAVSTHMIDDMNTGKENDETALDKTKKTVENVKDFVKDEELRKKITGEVMDEVTTRAEELPNLSNEDIDDIVDKVTARIKETCSDENIEHYLKNRDINDFNEKLTEGVTQDKFGIIGSFMQKWVKNMPSINDFNPIKRQNQ